jgi:alpha-1,2-mannosyltransferase
MKAPERRAMSRRSAIGATFAGLVGVVVLALVSKHYIPTHNWFFTTHYALGFEDLLSRFRDIWRLHHGYNLYSIRDHHQYFTYPPAALLLFWPLSWFTFRIDVVWWMILSVLALAGMIGLTWRATRPSPPWVIAAGSLWGALVSIAVFPVISTGLALGQIGLFLTVMLAADYLALKGRFQGVLTGVAAAIKIYPIVFVIGWLVRRQWRPALSAIGSGAVTTLISWALWPTSMSQFISRQLLGGHELSHFWHNLHWRAVSSSPYTWFFRPPFNAGSWASGAGWAASIAAVALGMWAAQRLWRAGCRASSFVMMMGASVLAGPVTWDHYYTFAPLLIFVVVENWERRVLVYASCLAMLTYAVPWALGRNEDFSAHGLNAKTISIFVARNALGVVTILVFAAGVYSTRSARENVEQPVAPVS